MTRSEVALPVEQPIFPEGVLKAILAGAAILAALLLWRVLGARGQGGGATVLPEESFREWRYTD